MINDEDKVGQIMNPILTKKHYHQTVILYKGTIIKTKEETGERLVLICVIPKQRLVKVILHF